MRIVRSKLPIFFHRRLLLAVVAGLAASVLLGAQLVVLTVVDGAELREAAERAIQRERYLPTWRGSIIDRNGVVLAEDRASWSVALPFEVISGKRAQDLARRQAQIELGLETWKSLSPEDQAAAIVGRVGAWNDLVETLYEGVARYSVVDRTELDSRVDAIRQSISRRVASVHDRQRARFEAEQDDRAGASDAIFIRRPIAEQVQAHVVVTGLTDTPAFDVRRFASELNQQAVAMLGTTGSVQPFIELIDGSMRSLPEASRTIAVDQSSLPRPLRSDEPATLLLTGVADHIIGRVRDRVLEEDLYRRPFHREEADGGVDLGGYRAAADMIGARGVEAAMEDQLRGSLGVERTNLETGEVQRAMQEPGQNVQLTIDIDLQAHVQGLLDPRFGLSRVQQFHAGWDTATGEPKGSKLPMGTPLDGAIVVLDIATGEILAMASSPTFAEGNAMGAAARSTHAPFLHRATEATYPPGSIVKPLVYVSAVTDRVVAVDETIECTGHLLPDKKDQLRCWLYKTYNATHGELDAAEAIKRSCNIYFFTLGQRMGLARMASWYRKWGLGTHLDTGLRYERMVRSNQEDGSKEWVPKSFGEGRGFVPDTDSLDSQRQRGESIMSGIGQGMVTWTPLQAANAYATLARGGVYQDATIIRDPALRASNRTGSMALDPVACAEALEGLKRAVRESGGTGHTIRYQDGQEPIFDIPGAVVWGKTGTATAPPRRVDGDGDGIFSTTPPDERIRGLDHAWFVGFAGNERDDEPRYAIAVLVEYGGSGGRVAGPIAAEVVRALQSHGYLEGGSS